MGSAHIRERTPLINLLRRPDLNLDKVLAVGEPEFKNKIINEFNIETREQAEIVIKYRTYIDKEQVLAGKMGQLDEVGMQADFDYRRLTSLSNEAREKLTKIRPTTLGQASRISGITPADVTILMVSIMK